MNEILVTMVLRLLLLFIYDDYIICGLQIYVRITDITPVYTDY